MAEVTIFLCLRRAIVEREAKGHLMRKVAHYLYIYIIIYIYILFNIHIYIYVCIYICINIHTYHIFTAYELYI